MKCGSCKQDHQTVAQVKLCYHNLGVKPNKYGGRGKPSQARHDQNFQNAHQELVRLAMRIPTGGYAIRNSGGPNDISFYAVQHPDRGEYTGQTLVWRRASDERIPLSVKESIRVLNVIVANPKDATLLFGRLGVCGVCGHSLTTRASRDRGIGPVCARKRGYADVA